MKNLLRSIYRIWSTECSSLTGIEYNHHNAGKCNIAVLVNYRFWVKSKPITMYSLITKYSHGPDWFFDDGKNVPFPYRIVISEYQEHLDNERYKIEVKAEIKAALSKTML